MVTIKEILEQRGYWRKWEGKKDEKTSLFPKGLCFQGAGLGRNSKLMNDGKVIDGIKRVEFVQDAEGVGELKIYAYASRMDINQFEGVKDLMIKADTDAAMVSLKALKKMGVIGG